MYRPFVFQCISLKLPGEIWKGFSAAESREIVCFQGFCIAHFLYISVFNLLVLSLFSAEFCNENAKNFFRIFFFVFYCSEELVLIVLFNLMNWGRTINCLFLTLRWRSGGFEVKIRWIWGEDQVPSGKGQLETFLLLPALSACKECEPQRECMVCKWWPFTFILILIHPWFCLFCRLCEASLSAQSRNDVPD